MTQSLITTIRPGHRLSGPELNEQLLKLCRTLTAENAILKEQLDGANEAAALAIRQAKNPPIVTPL